VLRDPIALLIIDLHLEVPLIELLDPPSITVPSAKWSLILVCSLQRSLMRPGFSSWHSAPLEVS
jgi:hypothetical protein